MVSGPACNQIDSAHCNAGPDSREIVYAIFAWSVGELEGCIANLREHWSKNPLQFPAMSEKGAGRAMGLDIGGAEEAPVFVSCDGFWMGSVLHILSYC